MKNLFLIITSALILSSCTFNLGTKGNGNIVSQERAISESFNKISANSGIDVYLTKGTDARIIVETDENLQQFIETEVKNGKLEITTSKKIGWSKAKKVYVTFIDLNEIQAASGASIVSNSLIKSENLSLNSSSGGELEIEVFSKALVAQTSSGSEIKVRGKSSSFSANASSGSEIDAKELQTIEAKVQASSGADIKLQVRDKLTAQASSGAEIQYYGNPLSVDANKSSSGSVNKK